ncbi:MAG: hypothetical protein HRU70_04200 [Phycisphaeraceae bacterium]|nr:MAG: hypothetical protein HRU70_04200 [Phycisphaeraceae bacterium]
MNTFPSLARLLGSISIAAAAVGGFVGHAHAQGTGTLPTSVAGDGPIFDFELKKLIDDIIPACSPKLLVFTQCYGGDFLNEFAGSGNTTVLTGSGPGKVTYYGGYHRGAAGALRPGPGRTARDVHQGGINRRVGDENPQTGGTVPPQNFPLDPVGQNNILSRHVLVYAGKPEPLDNADRDDIRGAFPNNPPSQSVRTVGGRGAADGYGAAASHANLKKALEDIRNEINASTDPCKEQFILFVTDHGDIHKVGGCGVGCVAPPAAPTPVQLEPFISPLVPFEPWLIDPDNATGLSVFIDLAQAGIVLPIDAGPFFHPGQVMVQVITQDGQAFTLAQFEETYVDFGDGLVGNEDLEGINLKYLIPEPAFIDSFFDVFFQVTVFNNTPQPLPIGRVTLDSGAVRRPGDGNLPCPPDFNGDGFLDFFDLDAFVMCFEGLDCPPGRDADYNGDGFVDFFDLDAFVMDFEEGC